MARSRSILIGLDQAVNTGSNFVAISLVAHVLSPLQFGVFATAQVVTLVLQIGAQAGSSDQLLAVPAGRDRERTTIIESVRDRYVVLLLVSVVALAAFAVSPSSHVGLIETVLAYLCALVFTDFMRNVLYSVQRQASALVLDMLLAVVEVVALLIWHHSRQSSAASAWQALAIPYLFVALVGLALTYRIAGEPFARRTVSRFRWRFALEMGGTLGISQLAQLVFVGVAGVDFAGHYRAAQLLLGPALLVVGAARPLLITMYTRRAGMRLHLIASATLALICLLWGAACLLLPNSVVSAALGRQAAVPTSLLLATIALATCQALFTTAFYRARALADDRWTTTSKVLQTAVVVVTTAVACLTNDSIVLVLGFAAGGLLPVLTLRQSVGSLAPSLPVPVL